MTQDEIIEMADMCGLLVTQQLEAFAKLVEAKASAKEREACAFVSEDCGAIHVAKRIRARGEA
jgi:hypothetical protein